MKPEVIVAVDVPDADAARATLNTLPSSISWCKIGLELFVAEGPRVLDIPSEMNKKVFLDLKFHDIPRTVARAVTSAAREGVAMLTVHAGGGHDMLKAAADAASEFGNDAPRIVAVTTLTSLDQNDLTDMGIERPLREHTIALGEMAINAGIDGLVCSVHEASAFRDKLGVKPILVTPGIRPSDGDAGDQKRIATPTDAVRSGSSFLVVGRPIVQADDPAEAANSMLAEIEKAASAQ